MNHCEYDTGEKSGCYTMGKKMREPASQKPGVSNTPKYGQQVFKEIYLVSWRGQE